MITIVVLSVFLNFYVDAVVLHKCCSLDNNLLISLEMKCGADAEVDNTDFQWFAKDALLSKDLKELSSEGQSQVMKWLTKDVQYGKYNFSCKNPHYSMYSPNSTFWLQVERENKINVIIRHDETPSTALAGALDDKFTLQVQDVCFDTVVYVDPDHNVYDFRVIMYCPGYSTPWIRKCCPQNMMFNFTSTKCSNLPENSPVMDWKPKNPKGFLANHFLAIPKQFIAPCTKSHALYERGLDTRCRGFSLPQPEIYFFENGSVMTGNRILHTEEYCGDVTWSADGHIFEQNLIYCSQERVVQNVKVIYGSLFILGGFCLFVTVVISLVLPELRQKIHNKIAITHNVALMLANMFWGYTMLLPEQGSISLCCFLCFAIQIFFLGSLFWMNAMCINMSSTFRTTQVISIQGGKSEMRRYGIYSLYAWGLPILIAVITAIMEFVEEPPWGLPRPGFTCFCDFDRDSFSVFVYLYGPMVVILIFNLVLYIFTVLKIVSVVRESKKVIGSNTTGGSYQSDVQMLILYTKLFFLMGITWLTEIIGWAVGGKMDDTFVIIMDVINLLRAVFIFILFVCKPQVLRRLREYLQTATGRLPNMVSSYSVTDVTTTSPVPSRKASQHEEVARKRSQDEWIGMKTMDSNKDKKTAPLTSEVYVTEEGRSLIPNENKSHTIVKT